MSLPLTVALADTQVVSCAECHPTEAQAYDSSAHHLVEMSCRTCHGGSRSYTVDEAVVTAASQAADDPTGTRPAASALKFDHGHGFRGKPTRREIPERCGDCHSDVSRMNPYGLPTDQLAQYRISGHGQALFGRNDDRVAVCIDCHGTHAIFKPQSSRSPVYPSNVPGTCGRCHGDPAIMADSGLSTTVVDEYRQSVHGKALLEEGDTGMPNCAVCHGSHAAIPPGLRDVGHVCGRCHKQEENHFLESHHAPFRDFPRCIGCHLASDRRSDHRISRVAFTPDAIRKAFRETQQALPDIPIESEVFLEAFGERRVPKLPPLQKYCGTCHRRDGRASHRLFLMDSDAFAMRLCGDLTDLMRHARVRYASIADRVDAAGRGVLLVEEEAMLVEDLRTKVVGLGPLFHALRPAQFAETVTGIDQVADEAEQSLNHKVKVLRRRYWALLPMWGFIAVFVVVLWIKYKRLKAEMVESVAG